MRVVYFDGYCNVCNAFVDFLIRRDRKRKLRFASLQGSTAKRSLPAELVSDVNTMVLQVDGSAVYVESSAAIRSVASLGGAWPVFGFFLMVPPFLRNWVYRRFAKNRYRLFGKRDTCRLPTPEERAQFLD